MAVNRKGGEVNSLEGSDDFGLADLGRLEQQYANEPIALRELRRRASRAKTERLQMNRVSEEYPSIAALPEFKQEEKVNKKVTADLQHRISLNKIAGRERLNEQAQNIIGREYSERAIGSYVSANVNSSGAQIAGMAMAPQGFASLAQTRTNILNQMQGMRQESMEAAGSYMQGRGVNPNAASTLQFNSFLMKDMAQQLVPITVAMQQLKQQGLDPQSRQRALINTGDKAAGLLNYNKLEDEMKSGKGLGALNPAELKKKETEAAEKLIKALEELRNSAGKTKDELEGLNKNAEDAAKEFEDISEAKKTPGGGDKYASAKIVAGTVAEALGVITNAFQNVMINQPMQQVANVQGAANIENEKYTMWHQALAGDMSARMNLGSWKAGGDFGNLMADRKDLIHAGSLVRHGITGALGVVQMGAGGAGVGGTVVGNNPIENIAQGAKSAISGAAGFVEEGMAKYRQTETARLRIDGTHAVVGAAKALNHITGTQLQQYRNYVMGINDAAGQMGGQVGENFLNETGNAAFLAKMEKAGIGVKEMGALSGSGGTAMGSMFRSEHVFQAVDLERAGFGTADQNVKRMGILGAAGTQDPGTNLAKIIEEAMQRGLNSSKAIDMIVENTARMTEETAIAGGGADPTEYITKAILRAVDKDNPNRELAGKIAYQTFQSDEGARHNIATSFPGIINVDRNMKDLGMGTDRMSAAVLTQIPTAMLGAYRDKSEGELKEFLEGRGVQTVNMDQSLFKGGKIIDILTRNAGISALAQQSGVGYATGNPGAFMAELLNNQDNPEIRNALITGKNLEVLSPEQRKLRMGLAGAAAINGRSFAPMAANAYTLAGGKVDAGLTKTIDEMIAEEASTTRGAAINEARLGKTAESGQAKEGAAVLGDLGGGGPGAGIKALAQTGRDAFEKAGADAEKTWGKAASETAQAFGKSATLLEGSAGKLDAAAQNLLTKTDAMATTVAQGLSAVVMKQLDAISNKAEQIKKKIDSIF